jgi:hypothetical protein
MVFGVAFTFGNFSTTWVNSPSPSRGGSGWGWGDSDADTPPIPLLSSPFKGEGRIRSICESIKENKIRS